MPQLLIAKTSKDSNFFQLQFNQSAEDYLDQKCIDAQSPLDSEQFAIYMDQHDPLAYVRQHFFYPTINTLPHIDKDRVHSLGEGDSNECIYLCGQSLGLMPRRTVQHMGAFLNDWATLGVYGHFVGSNPWAKCDQPCLLPMSQLVGCELKEVAVLNQLSVNLHLMMTRFYRPTKDRYKILYEDRAFPSDQYAIHSQIKLRGYDPDQAKVIVKPRENENSIRMADLIDILRDQGDSIALVLLGGIHYYTGQLFDIQTITRIAHEKGCCVGWDLAHVVGNVPLKLHEWQVDFAVWCTYKYLNGGAGCIGGIFVHSKHLSSADVDESCQRLDGWWGNRESTRFEMFDSIDRENDTANGFRISNPSIHQCAALYASLQIFQEIGIEKIRMKSIILTSYLQYLFEDQIKDICNFTLLTPTSTEERGAQLSYRFDVLTAREIHDELEKYAVAIDIRADVIRIAPVSLYNSFLDVFRFVSIFKRVVLELLSKK